MNVRKRRDKQPRTTGNPKNLTNRRNYRSLRAAEMASLVFQSSKAFSNKRSEVGGGRGRIEGRRWIRQNLLTFRWYLDSSVGFGAFEVSRLAHHAILDLIPPAMVFVV